MVDVAVSGRFYFRGKFKDLTVGITNGIITDIRKDLKAQVHYTLEGGILPGGTDTHVHFRDPGETEKEDFGTGSMAAVYGGTTTVLDMPNNRTPVTDYGKYADKKSAIKGKSFCDYGLYSLFTGTNADIISDESVGFKTFLGGSTNSAGHGTLPHDQLGKLDQMGKRMVFHAESESCLQRNSREATSLTEHDLARPPVCEKEAVSYVSGLRYGKKTVTHLSDLSSLPAAGKGDFLVEATPHHLLLNEGMDLGSKGKVNPPLRHRSVQENLLQAFVEGKIDIVSSDHAPHTEADKDEFQYAKSGIIGVETRIPLMLALVRKKVLSLEVFLKTAIEGPADSFGIMKGRIDIGYAADFFTVNLSNMRKINEERLHSKNPFSPFNGMEAVFPETVFIRGSPVLEDGEILSDHQGMYLNDVKGARSA